MKLITLKRHGLLIGLLMLATSLNAQKSKTKPTSDSIANFALESYGENAKYVKTTINSNRYEVKLIDSKITELIVNGEKIATANWEQYSSILEKIHDQISKDLAQFKRDELQFVKDQQQFVKDQEQFKLEQLQNKKDQLQFNKDQEQFKLSQMQFLKDQEQFRKDKLNRRLKFK